MPESSSVRPNTPLTLGYSPCPNDTFIFYALVHNKIDAGDLRFKERLLDVDTLNQKAVAAELDITKVSFHAYAYLKDKYSLLRSGGAMGTGCGPLLVAKTKTSPDALKGKKIAIPGRLTTAFLLLQLYEPGLAEDIVVMPFDRILDAVKSGSVEAGLVIHESRFTYPAYGFFEITDLGKWWETETGLPLPLGCIIAKKNLGGNISGNIIRDIETLIRKSVEYAFSHREETMAYIKVYSQELADEVLEQHINLYVNAYSLELGDKGLTAVEELFARAEKKGILNRGVKSVVVR